MDIQLPFVFDYRNPDYVEVIRYRVWLLQKIRSAPNKAQVVASMKAHYRNNPAQMIADWGITFDPRNADVGLPTIIPFIPFPKQVEFIEYDRKKWRNQEPGIVVKSRDMGMSWLLIGIDCCDALTHTGIAVGYGSRKEEYVDKVGSPKSLFWKARQFINHIPEEFRGGFNEKRHAPHMRITIPDTNSVITGEAGDNIGRGDRATRYRVDEAAFLERPELIDAALSNTTRYRLDLSSVNGPNNPFAQKARGGKLEVFVFDWRDDPRKDQAWYDRMCEQLDNPVIVAQEIDHNFDASTEGMLIPSEWVEAAIDADTRLGITCTGAKIGALDVADEGRDKNAYCARIGVRITHLSEWSGKGSDIMETVAHAFNLTDELGQDDFRYDADGLGAGVRGDARALNEKRTKKIKVNPFRGSGEVLFPDKAVENAAGQSIGRTNGDYFMNAKAQAWWALRRRFQLTYRWVVKGIPCKPDEIIVIPSTLEKRDKLKLELSQPTYSLNGAGKILVDKSPEGVKSPNLADSVMMCYAPYKPTSIDWSKA